MTRGIRKRGQRSWQVQIELPPDSETGKRSRRYFTVRGTRKDAEQAKTAAEYERDHGVDIAPDRITVGGLLERWLRDEKAASVEPGTLLRLRQTVRLVTTIMGTVRLQTLRPAQVQHCITRLLERRAASTVAVDADILRSALAWAQRMQLIAINPAVAVKAPRSERKEMVTLSVEQVGRLLDACGDGELRTIVYVAVHSGLRVSELMGLKWSDLDWGERRVAVTRAVKLIEGEYVLRTPKSARGSRSIALGQEAIDALRAHQTDQATHREELMGAYVDQYLVFAGKLGEVRSLGVLRIAFKRAARRAGFPSLRFHDLRHTMATLALRAGVHPRIVSERLGHASVRITLDTYSHVLPDMQRDAADALDAMLPRLPDTVAAELPPRSASVPDTTGNGR